MLSPRRFSALDLTAIIVWVAAVTSLPSRDALQGTQPGAFCVPDGWQSGRAVTLAVNAKNSAKPTVTRNMGDVIYSSSQQKILIDEYVFGGGERTTTIFDYPGRVVYTVRGESGAMEQTCTKALLPSPFSPLCVPENATMTKIKSYFGVTPPYVQFFMEFAGKQSDVNYRISLTVGHDTPLFAQQWGAHDGETFFQTQEFYNSTIWGTMPSNIFDPPAICNKSHLTQHTTVMLLITSFTWALLLLLCDGSESTDRRSADTFFHCCTPNVWTARIRSDGWTVSGGVVTKDETWMTFHYDSVNQRQAYTNATENGEPAPYVRVVEDFKNHTWTIVVNPELCVTYPLRGEFQRQCTPQNASFVSFAVAPVLNPVHGVFANTVYFASKDVTGHLTVTVGQCALVEEVRFWQLDGGEVSVDNTQYFDQTLSVDESVFDIPKHCAFSPLGSDYTGPASLSKLPGR